MSLNMIYLNSRFVYLHQYIDRKLLNPISILMTIFVMRYKYKLKAVNENIYYFIINTQYYTETLLFTI